MSTTSGSSVIPVEELNPVGDFGAIRRRLTEQLHSFLECPESCARKFLPRGVARRIFTENSGDVKSLFITAESTRSDQHQADREAAVAFCSSVIGDDEAIALSNVLATLLHGNVDHSDTPWKCFESLCAAQWAHFNSVDRDSSRQHFHFTDSDLPLSRADVRSFLGDSIAQGNLFFDHQFVYCPLVLAGNHMVQCSGDREEWRRPFLEENPIGRGSSGKVFQVRIANGHINATLPTDNRGHTICARKDFRLKKQKEAKKEWECATLLLSNESRHDNIMHALGGLQTPTTLSLFFVLAECDLGQYMESESLGPKPDSLIAKKRRLRQFIGIAGALDHLHNGMKSAGGKRMVCYHLDLKPQNILVVNHGTNDEKFMVTDFSISCIKREDIDVDYKKLFHQKRSLRDVSSEGVLGDGSVCIAPETFTLSNKSSDDPNEELARDHIHIDALRKRVTASTDIWHLGCVLSMFIAWLQGGSKGLVEFSNRRFNQFSTGDWFWSSIDEKRQAVSDDSSYCREYPGTCRKSFAVFKLNKNVEAWFHDLLKATKSLPEGLLYCKLWQLLKALLLVPDPEKRGRIEIVHQKMLELLEQSQESEHGSRPASNDSGDLLDQLKRLPGKLKGKQSR